MRSAAPLIALATTGCGRLWFDPLTSDGSTGDGGRDTPTVHTGVPKVIRIGDASPGPTSNFDTWLANQASGLTYTGTTTLDQATLADVDVVILMMPSRVYSAGEAAAIENVVSRGGALIGVSGFSSPMELEEFNSSVANFGFDALVTPDIDGPVTNIASHPITSGVSQLPFMGGYGLEGNLTPFAHLNASVVGGAGQHGAGRFVVWADDWILYNDTWTTDLQTFWDNALTWVWPTQ